MPPRPRTLSTSLTTSSITTTTTTKSTPSTCRTFTTTPSSKGPQTKQRREFFDWLAGPGRVFKQPPRSGVTNYLGAYNPTTGEPKESQRTARNPFPLNPVFISTPVVSDELASEIFRRWELGKSVRVVSAELNVTLERVAAIVRLKSVEKQWTKEGKRLTPFLTKHLHGMLPVTPLPPHAQESSLPPSLQHEPLNDLASHPNTHKQLFLPVSESRQFTRTDAGEAFHLPAADKMIPHPELVVEERERSMKVSLEDRQARAKKEEEDMNKAEEKRSMEAEARKRASEQVMDQGRWRWRVKNVETGKVGFRYGVPHEDRKKGQVKIPTRVD